MALHTPRVLNRRSVPAGEPHSSDDVIKLREALYELVNSDGWNRFVLHALDNYQGDGYRLKMAAALSKSGDNSDARVVHQACLEVVRLLQWPNDKLAELSGERKV
jgi:hypothetical protein